MQTRTRIVLVGVLALALLALCVHYGAVYDDNWPYPSAERLAEDSDAYEGDRVLLMGEVRSVDGDADRIVIVSDDIFEVTVHGFDERVEPGGFVQVLGTVREGGTDLYAERIVVVERDRGDFHYKLGTSALGAILGAGAFLWYWRIDWRRLTFEVRDG